MLYEAKVMDVQPGEKPGDGFRYRVHYKGWKNTWDDWVLADRIRPFDDEHKELAAQLHAQLKNSMQKTSKQPKKAVKGGGDSARGSEERGSGAPQGGRGRRGKDWELEQVRNDLCARVLFSFDFDTAFFPCPTPTLGAQQVLAISTWSKHIRLPHSAAGYQAAFGHRSLPCYMAVSAATMPTALGVHARASRLPTRFVCHQAYAIPP
jgi:hypothetical protein